MGQHAHTGQAMILAEELEADWNSIRVVTASNHDEFKNHLLFGMQRTDGSKSIMAFWDKLRIVGAGTKEILLEAAAKELWAILWRGTYQILGFLKSVFLIDPQKNQLSGEMSIKVGLQQALKMPLKMLM